MSEVADSAVSSAPPRPKIVFIGAGSFTFTRALVRDLLTFPAFANDAHIALVDIDPERLEFSEQAVRRIVREGKYGATVSGHLDRREALDGADAVLCTILASPFSVWRHDIEIPGKYGVDINIGDTRGPSGVFRALRTIPILLDICRDMEQLCPDAYLLNYTNPMAMLCRAIQSQTSIRSVGLCHSVQGTAEMLAGWIGAPMREITYECAGINHQSFYLRFEWNGKDAYPLLREAVEKPDLYQQEIVRNEMFKALGYYVTESSGHNSEYVAWFRKRPDLIEKYCNNGTGWNPGQSQYLIKHYAQREDHWQDEARAWLDKPGAVNLKRGNEYAAYILNALLGDGTLFEFNGNVPNTHLIDNLPPESCVEVPILVSRRGLAPEHVGPLPPQLAALVSLSAQLEDMVVEAARTGDARGVFWSICYDPLTSAVLSLGEIRQMVKEMFAASDGYLPQFKTVDF